MKKLTPKKLENLKGGGCMKWIRRYNRASDRGDDQVVLDALMDAFETCISAQYN